MTDDMKKQLLESFNWDREMIDFVRVNEHMSDRSSELMSAIREHLDQYTQLLEMGA